MGHCMRLVLPDSIPEPKQSEIIRRVAKRWGGITVFTGRGLWCGGEQETADNVMILECSIGSWYRSDETRAWWFDLVDDIIGDSQEECVFLSVRPETGMLIDRCGRARIIGDE